MARILSTEPADRGRRRFIGGVGAAAALSLGATPAAAIDCEFEGCLDVTRLPGGSVNWAQLVQRCQRFFGATTRVYIVSFSRVRANLPYMQRALPPIPEQIHIPEIYHATIERQHAGQPHFVWHYILAHEFAHVYQDRLDLISALQFTYADEKHVEFELHADFLAGFFLASEYGLHMEALDQIMAEVNALPSGRPEDATYHGEPHQRYFLATQGALLALRRPRPTLAEATAEGINRLGDVLVRPLTRRPRAKLNAAAARPGSRIA